MTGWTGRQCLCNRRRGFLSGLCHRTGTIRNIRSIMIPYMLNYCLAKLFGPVCYIGQHGIVRWLGFSGLCWTTALVCFLFSPSCICWRNLRVVWRTRHCWMSLPSNMSITPTKESPEEDTDLKRNVSKAVKPELGAIRVSLYPIVSLITNK